MKNYFYFRMTFGNLQQLNIGQVQCNSNRPKKLCQGRMRESYSDYVLSTDYIKSPQDFIRELIKLVEQRQGLIKNIENAKFDSGMYEICINDENYPLQPQLFKEDNKFLWSMIANLDIEGLNKYVKIFAARKITKLYLQKIILQRNQLNQFDQFIQIVGDLQGQYMTLLEELNLEPNEFIQNDIQLDQEPLIFQQIQFTFIQLQNEVFLENNWEDQLVFESLLNEWPNQ